MYELFELPVTYNGNELLFPAQLKPYGYTHHFSVEVYGTEVLFEPDEERNYRAIIEGENTSKEINTELFRAIAQAIEAIVK